VLKSYGGNLTSGDGVDNCGSSDEDYSDDEEEGEESYKPGGYHPVNIGDKYNNGRYTVIEKLGWGHFSTVWMCYDKKRSTPEEPAFVAMKIQKSAPHYREAALDEIELLSNVTDALNSQSVLAENLYTQENYVVRLIDHFDHVGPHGKHVCMVFEMLGENLLKIIKKYEYHGIPIPIVKNFARQICYGLDFLHRHCQIIHTDLKPENVLVGIAPKPTDMEKVMSLVGDGKKSSSSHNKSVHKKSKSTDANELTEAMEKLTVDNNTHGDLVKLTSDQKKKLKKKQKKKKQKAKKDEMKKGSRSTRKARAEHPPAHAAEPDKEQEKLEMMLMERESAPKIEIIPSNGSQGHLVIHNHDSNSINTQHHHAATHLKNEETKDSVDLRSDEENNTPEVEDTVERVKTLRLSAFMHLNLESRLDYPKSSSASSSFALPIQLKLISREEYLPPPRPFLASIPLITTLGHITCRSIK
jgi:hypothetical protein